MSVAITEPGRVCRARDSGAEGLDRVTAGCNARLCSRSPCTNLRCQR